MLSLLGVLVVIVGFALKLEPIAIIFVSAAVTAVCGQIPPGEETRQRENVEELLETVGSTFVANRTQLITLILMILTGTLERNGLKEAGAELIRKLQGLSTGMLMAVWGIAHEFFIIFKIPIGSVPAYVRPILMPMTVGIVESNGRAVAEEHEECMKALYGMHYNVGNFFGQCCFAANASVLLIQSTLANIGYEVDVMQIVRVQIPVAAFAMLMAAVYTIAVDTRMSKKCYGAVMKTQK